MNDYNVKVSVRNNKLISIMRENGIENMSELSRASGINYTAIHAITNLKLSAFTSSGEPRKVTKQLSDYFQVLPEHLFPKEMLHSQLDKNSSELSMSFDDIQQLTSEHNSIGYTPYEDDGLNEAVEQSMSNSLRAREITVLNHRFGMNGESPKTLKEVGLIMGVSGNRVRQIEDKALRKLRNPKNNKELRELVSA